jgi:hypothetical protein
MKSPMRCFVNPGRRILIVGALLSLGVCAVQEARADKPKSSGAIAFSDDAMEQATFALGGTEQAIGRFASKGELDFVPGADEGTLDGIGVVVLTAADGDQLVGVAACQLDIENDECDLHFSWRDSITLRDGTTVSNTGRFLKRRPPGLVVVGTAKETTPPPNIVILILIAILH